MTPLFQVIIPFRDRGIDPLRAQNLARVVSMWEDYGRTPWVISDGGTGDEQFNRSRAYNRGMEATGEEMDGYIFAESDMLLDLEQVKEAEQAALDAPGLVVPFSDYYALSVEDSDAVRMYRREMIDCKPDFIISSGRSKGAINVVSRRSIDMIGRYDESFEGNWYDDNAMTIAFEVCTGNQTRVIEGRAWHLWHVPGHRGEHLTPEDKAATAANKSRLRHYALAAQSNNVARIRQLTGGGS